MSSANLKHVIKLLILILLLSFIADKIIFYSLNKISDKVYTGQSIGKLNHFMKIKDSLDFMVFGSSRANHNINPTIISENSFNMGMDGRKLAYSATLIKLLPINKQQTVLLHVDTENAFSELYLGDDIKALSTKYNRNSIIKDEIDKLNQNNKIQDFYWSLSYNGAVLGILKNYKKPNYNYKKYNGYDPIFVSGNQRIIFEKIIAKGDIEKDCNNELVLNKIYVDYFNELISFCNKNNKKLIIFTSPKYSDNCKDDNIKLSQFFKNNNLIYYDLTDLFKYNNKFEYWKDKEHLSDKGAELFSSKIKSLISL